MADWHKRVKAFYRDATKGMPNVVHCETCGRQQKVDPAYCLGHGWPECCGHTMRFGKRKEAEHG